MIKRYYLLKDKEKRGIGTKEDLLAEQRAIEQNNSGQERLPVPEDKRFSVLSIMFNYILYKKNWTKPQ